MKRTIINFLFTIMITILTTNAQAYFSVMDTGKIIPTGKYRAIIGPQFILSGDNEGVNASGRFDAGIGESTTLRGLVGVGDDSMFYGGASIKYIPFPDFESQPALGVFGGLTFASLKVGSKTEEALTVRVGPLVSKDFETDIGLLTPYGALPLSVTFVDGDTIYPVHLVGGADFKPYNWENVSFMAEVGMKLNKAFSYIALAVSFEFADDI